MTFNANESGTSQPQHRLHKQSLNCKQKDLVILLNKQAACKYQSLRRNCRYRNAITILLHRNRTRFRCYSNMNAIILHSSNYLLLNMNTIHMNICSAVCSHLFNHPFLVISFRQRTNPFNSFHIVFTAVTNKRMLPFGVLCFCFYCLCCPIKNGLHFQFALQKKHIVIHCDESNRSEPIRFCR